MLIFCNDVLNPQQVDQAYAHEVEAAKSHGFAHALISFEHLVDNADEIAATRRVRAAEEETKVLYRGWMLRPDDYQRLYAALFDKGYRVINTPEAYQHCHHLPESYSVIESLTPPTIWLPSSKYNFDEVMRRLEPFGDKPLILKDYVKSRKHDWFEACFIPSASNRAEVERVVNRFVELQGEQLQGGLVFREYVSLHPIGTHPQSGMPLTKEFRLFFFDGELLLCWPYWQEAEYSDELPALAEFKTVASQVQSRFFTMDVAQTTDGNWIIVELGDGQVAGLPRDENATELYRALQAKLL
jgi:hypothetical protein